MRAAKSFGSVQSVNSSNDELFKSSKSYSSADGSSDDLSSEDLSACSFCQHPFDEEIRVPKFLPCFHTFCLYCLKVCHKNVNLFSFVSFKSNFEINLRLCPHLRWWSPVLIVTEPTHVIKVWTSWNQTFMLYIWLSWLPRQRRSQNSRKIKDCKYLLFFF